MTEKLNARVAIVSLINLRNVIFFSQNIPERVYGLGVKSTLQVSVDTVGFGSEAGLVNILFSSGWAMPHLKKQLR